MDGLEPGQRGLCRTAGGDDGRGLGDDDDDMTGRLWEDGLWLDGSGNGGYKGDLFVVDGRWRWRGRGTGKDWDWWPVGKRRELEKVDF